MAVDQARAASSRGSQATHNTRVWARGEYLRHYDSWELFGAEVIILARFREALTGRVLDVGCGAGRVLAYLRRLGAEVHGIDVSPTMVQYCRERFPGVDVHEGDLADLTATETGPFDAVVIPDNTLDIFDDTVRRNVLATIHSLLAPDGLLVFSSHNLAAWDRAGGVAADPLGKRLFGFARTIARGMDGSPLRSALGPVRAVVNHQRLAVHERRGADHAIINDPAHRYALLHYFIDAQASRAQLAELDYEVIDVLEIDGERVAPGQPGEGFMLHYVARAS